ncbi:MAG: tRNA1(Val) (adenine(37)-N6)-methyltransferase [Flavobacteriaceae bacterium]
MSFFKFKEFQIKQEQSAMKIGTDGVLLGSWVNLNKAYTILDVGTGTGLIALMMAQRSNAELIDALEIEDGAYEEAVYNFENSPWADRLFCYHADFQEFINEMDEPYDLIISNPPFYTSSNPSQDRARFLAREEASLPFHQLFSGSAHLLNNQGVLALILPAEVDERIQVLAKVTGLQLKRKCLVRGNEAAEVKRIMYEFIKTSTPLETVNESLIIEIDRHQYTDDYKNLVKDFYLDL